METQGKFNQKMLRKASFAHLHFDDMLNFRSVEQDKITGKVTKILSRLAIIDGISSLICWLGRYESAQLHQTP